MTGAGEIDDAAFAVEEEEVLGVGDGQGGVGFFAARGDFGADGADEDLLFFLYCYYLNFFSF